MGSQFFMSNSITMFYLEMVAKTSLQALIRAPLMTRWVIKVLWERCHLTLYISTTNQLLENNGNKLPLPLIYFVQSTALLSSNCDAFVGNDIIAMIVKRRKLLFWLHYCFMDGWWYRTSKAGHGSHFYILAYYQTSWYSTPWCSSARFWTC